MQVGMKMLIFFLFVAKKWQRMRSDLCNFWHHNKCVKMPGDTYKVLGRKNDPKKCGIL